MVIVTQAEYFKFSAKLSIFITAKEQEFLGNGTSFQTPRDFSGLVTAVVSGGS